MKITFNDLQELVSEPYLSRGLKYYQQGVVKFSSVTQAKVKAQVIGASIYMVQLMCKNQELSATCTCVAFEDYGPCKHIAATGYALLYFASYRSSEECDEQSAAYEHARKEFSSMTKQELIDWIFSAAGRNPDILEEFMFTE